MGELLYAQYSHAGSGIEGTGTEMILGNRLVLSCGMVVIVCISLYVVETDILYNNIGISLQLH